MGLDDYQQELVEVWPENYLSLQVFEAMATQWRTGMSGPTGLDYSALPIVMRQMQVPKGERKQLFDDIRVMEGAALKVMREQS